MRSFVFRSMLRKFSKCYLLKIVMVGGSAGWDYCEQGKGRIFVEKGI